MLTTLGIVSMMGAAWMGYAVTRIEVKRGAWWVVGVYFSFTTGMLGCLAIAYRCFGGEF